MLPNDNANKTEYRTACGGTVTNPEQYPTAMYKGELIVFCMQSCLKAFEADPDRFMAGEIEHPTEEIS